MEQKESVKDRVFDFYRLKSEFVKEDEKGVLSKTKSEELIMATSYTEAEKVAYEIAEDQERTRFGSLGIEIIKTKINDVLFNDVLCQDDNVVCEMICNFFEESEDSGVGLYSVKVLFLTVDEKTGKTKKSNQTFFVPATSNSDATTRIKDYLKQSFSDYVIRDTKFDKAEAIYWPKDFHQQKVKDFDLN